MSERYTKEKAEKALREFFLANCPRQFLRAPLEDCLRHDDGFRHVNVSWEAGWAIGCSLSCGIDREAELGWSSTGRSVAAATAAIALYRMVLDFAAMLECKRQEELSYVRQSDRHYEKRAGE